ncbi:MAG: hypothetical protein IMZ69_06160 [Spirochaetes bacterium]|nr:hypothetical protein [Spirochaetota bacterium]
MSGKAKSSIIVLFDHELRIAAAALKRMRRLVNATPRDQEAITQAVSDAVRACESALYHVISRKDIPIIVAHIEDIEKSLETVAQVKEVK